MSSDTIWSSNLFQSNLYERQSRLQFGTKMLPATVIGYTLNSGGGPSGRQAVFTRQGASASQMTAAKVLEAISRLPGMAEEADDAVSEYTEVKTGDSCRLLTLMETKPSPQTIGTSSMTRWLH